MVIQETGSLLHWNYFLALESDTERLSRYVEFTKDNFDTYSIEIAHLLLAASSEVDVIARQLCKRLDRSARARNIEKYKQVIKAAIPEIEESIVSMPRYGLQLTPWQNWKNDSTPSWWHAYNYVKHERNAHFKKANLRNFLNSMAGLFLLILYFYRDEIQGERMEPPPVLFIPPKDLAYVSIAPDSPLALFFEKKVR